jgi:hypothetical protein
MALIVVDQNDKIDKVHFACSPGGEKSTRITIHQARKECFPEEIKALTDDWEARKARLAVLNEKKADIRGNQISDAETAERKFLLANYCTTIHTTQATVQNQKYSYQ